MKKASLKLATEFAPPSMTYPSGEAKSHSLNRKLLKLLHFLPENFQHTQ